MMSMQKSEDIIMGFHEDSQLCSAGSAIIPERVLNINICEQTLGLCLKHNHSFVLCCPV